MISILWPGSLTGRTINSVCVFSLASFLLFMIQEALLVDLKSRDCYAVISTRFCQNLMRPTSGGASSPMLEKNPGGHQVSS